MKPKAKAPPRKKPVARSKKKAVPGKRIAAKSPETAKSTEAAPSKQEFAKFIWPRIKETTRFVDVPEAQGMVSYARPSGEQVTATLKWYTVSHGPRILGYYDDENDVCYIGRFVER